MATSGSTDFALTARQIVTRAFRLLKIIGGTEDPTSEEAETGEVVLNLMLKTWSSQEHLWIKTEGTQALTQGTASYAINAARRMLSIRRRISGIDTPMNVLSRQEYFDLPNKSQQGLPISWFFDPQRVTRTLYVWLTPDAYSEANVTLHYTYLRVIEDIDALENDPDVPQEWLEALIYNLAARLGPEFGADDRIMASVTPMAAGLLDALSAQDQEDTPIYFEPARRF